VKVKMAQHINVSTCDDPECRSVHICLWRNGKIFAEAVPVTLETAETLAKNILDVAAELRAGKGKPHVH
jgi:hypothetical protein